MTIESVQAATTVRRRRAVLAAIATALVAGIVTWNVVFDRAIEAAERRYLALARQHPGAVTIRHVMDPAIHDATVGATTWAAALAGAGAIAALATTRRLGRGRRQPVTPPD